VSAKHSYQIKRTFAKLKVWKVLRNCRLRGTGSAEAMAGIARLYNLTLAA
jgi:hypothetical protein